MREKQLLPVESTVMIWGENDTAIRTAAVISERQPVLFACPNQAPISDKYKTIDNARLQSIQGTNGRFAVTVMAGNEPASYEVGMVMIFPEPEVDVRAGLDEAISAEGRETIVITAEGCDPAVFEMILDRAAAGAGMGHRVFLIADELQVSSRTGEEICQQARENGVVIFKDADCCVARTDSGYTVEISSGSVGGLDIFSVVADRVLSIRGCTIRGDYARILDRMGVSQADSQERYPFKTRREGILVIWPCWGEPGKEDGIVELLKLSAAAYAGGSIGSEARYWIEPETCALCLTCYRLCPHKAVRFGQKSGNLYGQAMDIDPLACMGCGLCWSECPARAVRMTAEAGGGRAMILACENSGGPLLENSPVPCRLYPCAGSISVNDMLETMVAGADRLYVLTCRDGKCQHEYGGLRLSKRVDRLNKILSGLGLDKQAVVLKVSAQDRAEDIIRKVGERP